MYGSSPLIKILTPCLLSEVLLYRYHGKQIELQPLQTNKASLAYWVGWQTGACLTHPVIAPLID